MKKITRTKKLVLLASIVLVIGAAAYATTYYQEPAEKRAVHALLHDVSNSLQKDDQIIRALVEQTLANPEEADRLDVYVLKTGNPETNMEPIAIKELHLANRGSVIEGNEAAKEEHGKLMDETLEAVLRTSFDLRFSPIDLAVSRTLEQMRAAGCGQQDVACTLWIRSDGIETESEYFLRSFERGKASKKSPPPLDNTGIQVRWCGWAERINPAEKKRRNRAPDVPTSVAMELWRPRFTVGDAVVFSPFCPKDAISRGGVQ
ncbi:MAG: hypothetical protein WC457_02335 [Patescibacteria group bacterium]